ncbi:MAG: class I SAM-dependent methyltransferase, partial [Actinomycetota bacterium]
MTHDRDLIRYYDQDAPRRDNAALGPTRIAWRNRFIELLAAEDRRRVIEFGCGPGHDGEAFAAAGLSWTGIDLSIEHARRAAGHGVPAVVGSLFHPPVRPRAFDAAWAMGDPGNTVAAMASMARSKSASATCTRVLIDQAASKARG